MNQLHHRPDPPRPRRGPRPPRRDRRVGRLDVRRPRPPLRRDRARASSAVSRVSTLTGTAPSTSPSSSPARRRARSSTRSRGGSRRPRSPTSSTTPSPPSSSSRTSYRELADAALALAARSRRSTLASCPARRPIAPDDDDPLLLVYTTGTTGKPKGALLTHANCFWTNLSFDLATGISGHDVVLQVLPQFHCGGWNVQSILAWWKGARRRARARLRRRAGARADRVRAGHDDDGRAGELPAHGRGTRVRDRRPLLAPARRRRRRADAGAAARHLGRARRRHRPGLRADRGRAERAVPAARGRAPQGGLRGQAVPVRRLRDRRETASCSSAGRTSSPATGATPRRPPRRSATAGCSPGTSPSATTRATTGCAAGSRSLSSRAARTSTRPRSRRCSTTTRPSSRPPSSALPDERWGEVCVAYVVTREPVDEAELREHCARGSRGSRCRRRSTRRRSAAQLARQGHEVRARAEVARMTDVVTAAAGRPLSRTRAQHAPQAARRGRARLRRARVRRRVDREAHRGGRRRPGHLLPLLRLEARDLRRARPRPEPARPPRDEGGLEPRARPASSPSSSASRRTSASPPTTRRSTGSSGRPSSSRRRCSTTTTTALSAGLHRRRCARRRRAARSATLDAEVDRLGADGARRADRHALDPLGRATTTAAARPRRARADHPLRPRGRRVRTVGLQATASYLPERWMTAAEIGEPPGSRST